jgi:ABC-type glycerol-3-phosphate transport system permease component
MFSENLKGVSRIDNLELILENVGMQNAITQHEKEMNELMTATALAILPVIIVFFFVQQ